jgi:hypothetical protein
MSRINFIIQPPRHSTVKILREDVRLVDLHGEMATKYACRRDKELEQMGNRPLSMSAREDFWRKFLLVEGPRLKDGTPDPKYQEKMKKMFGFGYHNQVGEVIYAMVTSRPDISTSTVRCTA